MSLRAVIFDMGGTIETFAYTDELRLKATAEIQRILNGAGIDLGLSDKALYQVVSVGLKRYHDYCLKTLIEFPPQRVWREFIFHEFSIDTEKLDSVAEDLAFFVETQYYYRDIRPEIPGVLEAIQKMGLKIGLISNVNSRGQVPTNLSKYGIIHYFDPIVLSSEYGIRKPDPSIFHYAARLMHLPTSACMYVGDRVMRDVLGAQKAGYRLAVQIKHDFEHGEEDDGAIPDAIIENMTELLDILKKELSIPEVLPSTRIRAFLFDAGDILYHRPKRGEDFSAFLEELGLDPNKQISLEKAALTQQAYRGQMDVDEYYAAYLRLLGVEDPDLIRRGVEILNQENLDIVFFAGVKDTLMTLKRRGYLLGILTDTVNSVRTKLSWFERGGFGNVWDSIISSSELGMKKPEPAIYNAALEQLGLSADQVAFVGHKLSELDGARAVGLPTVAFNYDKGAAADHYIHAFPDLLDIPLLRITG